MLVNSYNTRLHTTVCITGTIINFGWTVISHLPFGPGLTPSDYYLCWFFERQKKDNLRGYIYASNEALQNVTF
jgi:hypothetical protein